MGIGRAPGDHSVRGVDSCCGLLDQLCLGYRFKDVLYDSIVDY